jgi:hypothetical protein
MSKNTHTYTERLVPYEKTVHEHKAPTDKSVELLNEFQEKAIENIMHHFKLNDNIITAEGFFINTSYGTHFENTIIMHCKFVLNGKEFHVKDTIDLFGIKTKFKEYFEDGSHQDAILNVIYKVISEKIAKDLIMQSKETVGSFLEESKFQSTY